MSASTETSPLLPGHTEPAEGPAEEASPDTQLEANHGAPLEAQSHQRAIRTIRILLFATSIAATAFGVASLIICNINGFGRYQMSSYLSSFVVMVCLIIQRY
jgi:hypothetical protein